MNVGYIRFVLEIKTQKEDDKNGHFRKVAAHRHIVTSIFEKHKVENLHRCTKNCVQSRGKEAVLKVCAIFMFQLSTTFHRGALFWERDRASERRSLNLSSVLQRVVGFRSGSSGNCTIVVHYYRVPNRSVLVSVWLSGKMCSAVWRAKNDGSGSSSL